MNVFKVSWEHSVVVERYDLVKDLGEKLRVVSRGKAKTKSREGYHHLFVPSENDALVLRDQKLAEKVASLEARAAFLKGKIGAPFEATDMSKPYVVPKDLLLDRGEK